MAPSTISGHSHGKQRRSTTSQKPPSATPSVGKHSSTTTYSCETVSNDMSTSPKTYASTPPELTTQQPSLPTMTKIVCLVVPCQESRSTWTTETKTVRQATPTFCKFFELPTELRLIIYEFHLSAIPYESRFPVTGGFMPALLHSTREIRNEAMGLYVSRLDKALIHLASKRADLLRLLRVKPVTISEAICRADGMYDVAKAAKYSWILRNESIKALHLAASTTPEDKTLPIQQQLRLRRAWELVPALSRASTEAAVEADRLLSEYGAARRTLRRQLLNQ